MISRKQIEPSLYVSLELSGRFITSRQWPGFTHQHVFWEIIYVAQGNGIVNIEDRRYPLNAGQAILICPKERHSFVSDTCGTGIVYVGFQYEAGQSLETSSCLPRMLFDQQIEKKPIEDVLLHFFHGENSIEMAEDLLQALFPVLRWMRSSAKQPELAATDRKKQLCYKTMDYIRNNIDRFVSVREAAASLYVTPHYLGITFAASMGQTILHYQQQIKMERAASLIRQGKMKLSEISDHLGYSSPQYFSKCFQAFYGVPPSQMKNYLSAGQRLTEM